MPIYEFQCQACGAEIEVLQKISDPHPVDCEVCGKAEMKKKVTAAAFRLSGAGWYETDFKKDKDKQKNLTDSKSDKKIASAPKASTESSDKTSKTKSKTTESKAKKNKIASPD